MNSTLLTILIAIFFVGFLIFALSITLIRKGHNLESEVGDNRHMKERGIECTSKQIMDEERALGNLSCDDISCAGACSTCDADHDNRNQLSDNQDK